MGNWQEIRRVIDRILERQRYRGKGHYEGERCFLTAYQIAVLVKRENPTLRVTLPIGGDRVGGSNSFAKEIARRLSQDIRDNPQDCLEIRFFSIDGLDVDGFSFDGGKKPSLKEFSMFRLREDAAG